MTDELKNDPSSATQKDESQDANLEQEFFEQNLDSPDVPFDPSLVNSFKPRWRRNPILSLFFIPLSLFLIFMLWTDLVFGVKGLFQRSPEKIGDATEALAANKVRPNTWVNVQGIVGIQSQLAIPDMRKHDQIVGYHVYYVLLNTKNRMLVKRYSKQRLLTERLPTDFTGRLMSISNVEEGSRLQEYYRNHVRDPSSDILFREFQDEHAGITETAQAPDHLLNSVEKLREINPTFITDAGDRFILRQDMSMDVKAYYLPDMIVSFHREHAIMAEITLTGGVSRGGSCPPGIGGSVILRRDPDTLTLPAEKSFTGEEFISEKGEAEPCMTCQETDVPMVRNARVVRIPANTRVVNALTKKEIEFNADGTYTVAGASCGNPPEQIRLEITHHPFERVQDCYRWLIARGYPFAPLPDSAGADTDWEIVAHIPETDILRLREEQQIRRDCIPSETGEPTDCRLIQPALRVSARWRFLFNLPVQNIRIVDQDLVILRARTDFPPFYEESHGVVNLEEGHTRTARILKARPSEEAYRIPLNMIAKLQFESPTVIQDNAFLLIEGAKPTDFDVLWKIPVVLLLLGLFFLNLKTAFLHFILRSRG